MVNYFPDLTVEQKQHFAALPVLYAEWNEKINVISRKDISDLLTHHILHSLALTRIIQFKQNIKILDLGSGGGFPGIPLAIFFPEVEFVLVDSIAKKMKVAQAICETLNLKNVRIQVARVENIQEKFHFIVTRAVAQMPILLNWSKKLFFDVNVHPSFSNGIFAWKGGDLQQEMQGIPHQLFNISDFFTEDFFIEKKIVFVAKR